MNKKKFFIIVSFTVFISTFVLVFCPILVKAAQKQSVKSPIQIKIESINLEWADKNKNKLEYLELPEYVAPGEIINLNEEINNKRSLGKITMIHL